MNRRERKAQEKIRKKTDTALPAPDLRQAVSLHVGGKRAEAETLYLALLRREPDNADFNYYYGVLCLETGRLDGALRHLRAADSARPDTADVLAYLGVTLQRTKDLAAAVDHLERALAVMPGHKMALPTLGGIFLEQGRTAEAEKIFRQALALDPHDALAQGNLGMALRANGKPGEALTLLEAASARQPRNVPILVALGNTLHDLNRPAAAEPIIRRALEIFPGSALALNALGNILKKIGRADEAQEAFAAVLRIAPDMQSACHNYLALLEAANRIEDHRNELDEARKKFPDNVGIALIAARLARRDGDFQKGIDTLKNIQESAEKTGPAIAYERGLLYSRLNDAASAFENFKIANGLMAGLPEAAAIDRSAYPGMIARLREQFTKEWVSSWSPPAPRSDKTPVFLVGFPRSGTTLLDQILSSHPSVHVAEERRALNDVHDLISRQDSEYPAALSGLDAARIEALRAEYFSAHRKFPEWKERSVFVDKFPLNIVHAGLIHRLFPGAKIIFALRHPCDCVLSCFMQGLELNEAMIHFLDLESGARLYDRTMDLWCAYESVLPLAVHKLRYEDLVVNFRDEVARLLDFLGLEWNDAVLEYDKTARERGLIRTPSYAQVTEKIYSRASGRWLRYRDQMTPALGVLLPWAEKFGYGDAA